MAPKFNSAPANTRRVTDFFRPVSSSRLGEPNQTTIPQPKPEQALPAEKRDMRTRTHKSPSPPKRSRGSTPSSSAPLPQQQQSPGSAITPSSSFQGSQESVRPRVIPSSDGEESDLSSEDSDELEDLSTMMGTKRPPARRVLPVRSASPQTPAPEAGRSKKPKYKFDLKTLVAEKEKEKAHEENLKAARELIAKPEEREKSPLDKDAVPTSALESVIGENAVKRFMRALDRKDAWKTNQVYHFFDLPKQSKKRKNPFPAHAIEGGPFTSMNEAFFREQLFLTGFVQDMTLIGQTLPDEVLLWLSDELCLEKREDLSYAYAHVLEALPSAKVRSLMNTEGITRLFGVLGAREESLDFEKPLETKQRVPKEEEDWNHWNMTTFVRLLAVVAYEFDSTTLSTACGLLIRLSLDSRVARYGDLLGDIEECLKIMMCAIPEEEWLYQSQVIANTILKTVTKPELRPSVLGILPVYTRRVHLFRRRLALAFLFEELSFMSAEYTELVRLDSFVKLLQRPQYVINSKTDYAKMQSDMNLLDIAIDSGTTAVEKRSGDREVDQLVDQLRRMFSRIIDTNARDISRTETKDAIERLIFRLDFSVRSKERSAFFDGGFAQTKLNFGGNA